MRKAQGIVLGLLLAIRVSAGTVQWAEAGSYWCSFSCNNGSGGCCWEIVDDFYNGYNGYPDLYNGYLWFKFSIRDDTLYQGQIRLLARGTNLIKMNPGDAVDHSTMFGTDKTYFYGELQEGSTESPLQLSSSEPLLMGFAADNGANRDIYGDCIYGWIRLIYDGTNLSFDSGAVAIGTDVAGIYAGTGIIIPRQVPEPSIPVLALIGIVALMLRREVKTNP